MKKDYARLGNLTERDTEIKKGGKFDGKSKALAKHEEFAEKYGFKEPEPIDSTATREPISPSAAASSGTISLSAAEPPLSTIIEGDEEDDENTV